jgi:hypothetical protein
MGGGDPHTIDMINLLCVHEMFEPYAPLSPAWIVVVHPPAWIVVVHPPTRIVAVWGHGPAQNSCYDTV